MAAKSTYIDKLAIATQQVSKANNADLFLFAGDIDMSSDRHFNKVIREEKQSENLFLLLSTWGGDAHAAYRIGRCAQEVYKKVQVFVHNFCKSAGTLVALCANEIIMSDGAEFGPLDVQLLNSDVEDRTSGLTPAQAMATLRDEAANSFEALYIHIRKKTRISSDTAAHVAGELVGALFNPIYQKLDPVRIGENDRYMAIAHEYGERLTEKSRILKPKAIQRLISAYPSHSFVIDRRESEEIFSNIRSPSPEELALAQLLETITDAALFDDEYGSFFNYLPQPTDKTEHDHKRGEPNGDEGNREAMGDAEKPSTVDEQTSESSSRSNGSN